MSSSNRKSKEIAQDRQSLRTDRQSQAVEERSSPRHSRNSNPLLSVYNVRFPANICEHQAPSFARQPSALPGRGGGAIVVPAEKPSPRVSPRPKTSSKTKAVGHLGTVDELATSSEQQVQVPKQRQITLTEPDMFNRLQSRMTTVEGRIVKRDAKNR